MAKHGQIEADLRYAQKLEYLQIADSGLVAPPVLSSIPKSLKYLNLSGNRLSSFMPYEQLPSRIRVYLFGNPIANKSTPANIGMDMGKFTSEVPVEFLETY